VTPSAEHTPSSAQHEAPKSAAPRRGFAAAVLGGGEEPDPRFTLANERTFLAWIRTALALLAGGIAVEAFTFDLFRPGIRTSLAVLLLVLAIIVACASAFRWLGIERAMRHKTPLPLPALVPVLAAGGALAAGAVLVFLLTRSA
jgi:putative membrane protein